MTREKPTVPPRELVSAAIEAQVRRHLLHLARCESRSLSSVINRILVRWYSENV
jgi:hypothetical protein